MPPSVMPKGVEHSEGRSAAVWKRVGMPPSVMPKGVEHPLGWWRGGTTCSGMPPSVMPKGVEHLIVLSALQKIHRNAPTL